jgi:hypothetical protein
MKKAIILVLTLCATMALAAPATYNILKVPAGSPSPTVDGSMGEWNDSYLVDSLKTNDNVFCFDDSCATFNRDRFQMYVYACHDDNNVYYAVKVMADNKILVSGTYGGDCIKMNPGGQAAGYYIWSNNTIQRNPSSPYQTGTNMEGAVNATGNGTLPTYETSLSMATLDQFMLGNWQICVGTEDNDRWYGGVGVECKITHTGACWNANPWDNQLYYPTWQAITQEGQPLTPGAVESKAALKSSMCLAASPNPFTPSTVLSYTAINSGTLKIYDVNGKVVSSFSTKAGFNKVKWNGTDMSGKNLSSGVYVARLVSGNNVLDQRLFLTR